MFRSFIQFYSFTISVYDGDDCEGNDQCLNEGKCIDGRFSFTCQCVGQFAGRYCQGNHHHHFIPFMSPTVHVQLVYL